MPDWHGPPGCCGRPHPGLLIHLLTLQTMPKQFLLAAALLLAFGAHAQPGNGGSGPDPAPLVTAVPLDGGASLLLVGGIGYAVRRLRQRRAKA